MQTHISLSSLSDPDQPVFTISLQCRSILAFHHYLAQISLFIICQQCRPRSAWLHNLPIVQTQIRLSSLSDPDQPVFIICQQLRPRSAHLHYLPTVQTQISLSSLSVSSADQAQPAFIICQQCRPRSACFHYLSTVQTQISLSCMPRVQTQINLSPLSPSSADQDQPVFVICLKRRPR